MQTTKIFSTRISSKLAEKIKKICNSKGIKIQSFAEMALYSELVLEGAYDKKSVKGK